MGILDILSIDSNRHIGQGTGNVTIGSIKKILGKKFRQEMDLDSDDETSELIFPSMFIIYLHPDDYQARVHFFERWGTIILARIYSLIRKKKRRMELRHQVLERFGKRYPNVKYTPSDARWCVQFTVDCNVSRGKIRVDTSYQIPFQMEVANNAPRIVQDPGGTIRTRNPKTKKLEKQGLDDIQVLGEGIRIYMFDKTLQENPNKINELHADEREELAILSWNSLEWSMYESYIMISGINDSRHASNILRINSNKVQETHVVIQYKDKEFQLAAWGPTMLNERDVEVSTDASHIKWVKLNPKSTIVLNNDVVVEFKAR